MKRILAICASVAALPSLAVVANAERRPAPPLFAPSASGFAAPSSTTHFNAFTFGASADSTTANPGTTNLYRISGSCPATLPAAMETNGVASSGWSKISTGNAPSATPAAPVYDTNVAAGQTWSYVVTAVIGGESSPSNCVSGTTPTFSTGTLTITSN